MLLVNAARSLRFGLRPAALQRAGGLQALARPFSTAQIPAGGAGGAVSVQDETMWQKAMRWSDFTGFWTMWYSRKAFVMDQDPWSRVHAVMLCEFERKLLLWFSRVMWFCVPFTFWAWYEEMTHLENKPCVPQPAARRDQDCRKLDYAYLLPDPVIQSECKDCRMFEFECKKQCYDRLREIGYPIGDLLSYPRTQSAPRFGSISPPFYDKFRNPMF